MASPPRDPHRKLYHRDRAARAGTHGAAHAERPRRDRHAPCRVLLPQLTGSLADPVRRTRLARGDRSTTYGAAPAPRARGRLSGSRDRSRQPLVGRLRRLHVRHARSRTARATASIMRSDIAAPASRSPATSACGRVSACSDSRMERRRSTTCRSRLGPCISGKPWFLAPTVGWYRWLDRLW